MQTQGRAAYYSGQQLYISHMSRMKCQAKFYGLIKKAVRQKNRKERKKASRVYDLSASFPSLFRNNSFHVFFFSQNQSNISKYLKHNCNLWMFPLNSVKCISCTSCKILSARFLRIIFTIGCLRFFALKNACYIFPCNYLLK